MGEGVKRERRTQVRRKKVWTELRLVRVREGESKASGRECRTYSKKGLGGK